MDAEQVGWDTSADVDTAEAFAEYVRNTFYETDDPTLQRVDTFAEAGMLTLNAGLVVTLPDGSEYQLTIVKSRNARR